MADNNAKVVKTTKKSWFKGMAAEFKKIIWPDRETVAKESVAVVIVSVILGLLIVLLDFIINSGLSFLIAG